MNNSSQRAAILVVLALLLVTTRLHLPATLTHFGGIPDASWAVFFLGGFYLRGWSRWAFPLFMALAVLVDYVVISGQGINFWTHYCVSPGYWFLLPAHLALWTGGLMARRYYSDRFGRSLAIVVVSLFASVAVCHLLAQGSFYWMSSSVSEPSLAGWWKNYSDWFLPYLRVAAIYVGLAVIAHVGVQQLARVSQSHGKSAR